MPSFLIDSNLGLDPAEEPWRSVFSRLGITTTCTTDLPELDRSVEAHEPDIVFMPIADFHRVLASGDRHYRGLAMLTSKFTGATTLPSVLVVGKNDPATCLDDLQGASFGYINRSCTSSYYAPAILLQHAGRSLSDFFDLRPTVPWQGQIDAVVSGDVRATMVLEDVWKTTPSNAETTKVIGRYDQATGALIVVRDGLDETVVRALLDTLLAWKPKPGALFGGFAAFTESGVARFFQDLDQLPASL
ncbi:phosphate/phosphite/phosphonate ABC transporter substrate-binding protein [Mycolicibacterium sp. Dal123E01]|uniref:phosphate/phosphite/phosphonate ABC transporter substrate-binding protein n=1 Tax=Mycolicibacterium sp. Dal123E01 TaxID=3457578 RepID=UPI00403EA977